MIRAEHMFPSVFLYLDVSLLHSFINAVIRSN